MVFVIETNFSSVDFCRNIYVNVSYDPTLMQVILILFFALIVMTTIFELKLRKWIMKYYDEWKKSDVPKLQDENNPKR